MKKKLFVLFIAVIFITINGCQTKEKESKKSSESNDLVAELLKGEILENTNAVNAVNSNYNLTEPISGQATYVVKEDQKIPVELEAGNKNSPTSVSNNITAQKNINDKPIIVPETEQLTVITPKKGSFIKIGNDTIGQKVAPRKFLKLTLAVFTSSKKAKYIDFNVYAVPKNGEVNFAGYYLIGYGKNIEVINNQSQFTKYWNGNNTDGTFIVEGKYNIYLYYKIKDTDGNIISQDGRFWGRSQNYYLKLN